jgi:hypothetical protein
MRKASELGSSSAIMAGGLVALFSLTTGCGGVRQAVVHPGLRRLIQLVGPIG